MPPRLYLETSVVSYMVARPSRDVLVVAHQQITREWWADRLGSFEVYVSDVVLLEAEQGDPAAARERVQLIAPFPVLALTADAERLASVYLREMPLPATALRDALHMAIASLNGMEYLVTWNCRHIAHGRIKRRLQEINGCEGMESPVICTPEELGGETDVE